MRKPEDEFFDLSSIEPLRSDQLMDDGSLEMMTTAEGHGSAPEPGDTIYYKHQTRFDNGLLVDFDERRKVVDKVVIDDPKFHAYLNTSFKVMRRGQTAWLKIGESLHHGGYHTKKNLQKRYMDKEADVGQTIWLKVEVCNISRDVKCPMTAPLETKLAFYEKVRATCRELVSFQEYSNAATLYARCA